MKSGDPNGRGLPRWPAFENASGPVLMPGEPIAAGDVAGLKTLKIFDEAYTQLRSARP